MLRRAPAAEPGVVGGIEDDVRPVAAVDHLARKDDFVADLEADLAPAGQRERTRAWAGREVDVAGREARETNGGKQRAHRQIFAIGNEVRLVVASEHAPA